MKLKWKIKTAVFTVLEVWSSGGITRAVIWDSIRGLVPLEHVRRNVLLFFSVKPFKIDQNKNQNRSTDKVQNLGNERRYIYKDLRQDSGQRNISYTRYAKKCFTQT